MINVKELMIGNWFKSNIYQQVTLETFEYLLNEKFAPHEAVQPIPLTHDMLKSIALDLARAEGVINVETTHKRIKLNGYPLNHLQYFHQLQNLFYVLTGKEMVVPKFEELLQQY